MIAIDDKDDLTAFRSVKGANKDGYVTLGTVTIMTKQVVTPTSPEQKATPRLPVCGWGRWLPHHQNHHGDP